MDAITAKIVGLNNLWLLCLALVPFTFIVASEYIDQLSALTFMNIAAAMTAAGQLFLGRAVRSLRPENTASAPSHRVNFARHFSVFLGFCVNLGIVFALVAAEVDVPSWGTTMIFIFTALLPSTTARWTMWCSKCRLPSYFTKENARLRAREIRPDPSRVGGRIAALTDGVLAVVGTLTLLEIRAPPVGEQEDVSLISIFVDNRFNIISFALTFSLMLMYWTVHHDITGHVRAWPPNMRWLNMFFLYSVCFLPFAFSLMAHHPVNKVSLAFVTSLVFISSTVLLFVQMLATRSSNSAVERASKRKVWVWTEAEPKLLRSSLAWILWMRAAIVPCAALLQFIFLAVWPEASLAPMLVAIAIAIPLQFSLQKRWASAAVEAYIADDLYSPGTIPRVAALQRGRPPSVHINAPDL